jgi:hypothetical protein
MTVSDSLMQYADYFHWLQFDRLEYEARNEVRADSIVLRGIVSDEHWSFFWKCEQRWLRCIMQGKQKWS